MLAVDQDFSFEPLTGTKTNPSNGKGAIVRVRDKRNLQLLRRTLDLLSHQASAMRAGQQEERISRLVEALMEAEPRSALEADLEADNAALRASYLKTVPSYTAADLHKLAGSRAANKSALAGGWKESGRVFAVPYNGADRFPGFQFRDGKPLPIVKDLLSVLPPDWSPWQVAFWFASGNGWLSGAAPQDSLSDKAAVMNAAEQASRPTVG